MWSISIAALLICIPINVLLNSISVVVETYRQLHPGRSADGVAYISGEPNVPPGLSDEPSLGLQVGEKRKGFPN